MHYCDECAKARDWPITMFRSRGKCETCGKLADCSDRPSRLLPMPNRDGHVASVYAGRSGAYAVCTCGWRSRVRTEGAQAHEDRDVHLRAS